MKTEKKATLINLIIQSLNETLRAKNKQLCKENLYSQQKPLHSGEMFLQLSFIQDSELEKIARVAGV